jgi:hypothetical protein
MSNIKNVLSLSDNELISYLLGKIVIDVEPPLFPSDETSKVMIGSSREHSLREALRFKSFISNAVSLSQSTILVDVGTGWGRIPRIFLNQIFEKIFTRMNRLVGYMMNALS